MIMQYRKDKNGNEISVLGYGCMRFTKEGGHADIDKAEKEVMAAIDVMRLRYTNRTSVWRMRRL